MIVDEEETFCGILSEFFRGNDFDVRLVHTVDQAMKVVESFAPDVVLTDIRMPGRDGFELIEELRNRPDKPVIIGMSAYGRVRPRRDGLRLITDAQIEKPFKMDVLLKMISGLLDKRQISARTSKESV